MFFWLILIILSHLFFGLAFFGDKLVLSSRINPKLYTFYVGVLNMAVVVFIPFITFNFPNMLGLFFIMLDALVLVLGVYTMFIALEKLDASRVMPTIGAAQPLFVLFFTWMLWGGQVITVTNFLAFVMLLFGTTLISLEGKIKLTGGYLLLILFSSLLLSLDYIFSKLVFLQQPFLQGLIWMRIFTFLFSLVFLFDKKMRSQIFTKTTILNKKNGAFFLFAQSSAGMAGLLQSFAIFLVPVSYLAIMNSLRGIQYIFLFMITLFFSFFFPKILKEDIALKVVAQKIAAMILIVAGLAILISY